MTTTEVSPFATAAEMLTALRRRDISAVELLEIHLRQIERHNPALNAIVIPDYDNARRAAEAADAARSRGEDGPLLGLPLTIKDCIDVAGLCSTAGVPELAENRPEADSRVAARVRAAGGVILGKTNVPPMAADWQANNPVFGRTNNPWDLARTPGGSTGGGAAAVAAGLTALEFGSDIGGSIRVPAAFCGVYGHRPSETAIPRSGHTPGSPAPNPATAMGVQGPLARAAEDLELALDVVAGPETGEEAGWRLVLPEARHARLADFRMAVLPRVPWLPVDDEVLAVQERTLAALRRAGATVREAQPDGFDDLRAHHALYLQLLMVMTSAGMPAEERRQSVERLRSEAGNEFQEARARGLTASAADLFGWFGQREKHRAAYRAFFTEWDVLLCPAYGVPAFPHVPPETPFPLRTHTVNGAPTRYDLQLGYPAVATLSGQPATAFPAGLTAGGLPVGLQAVGPYLEDRTPIRFAALLAEQIGGF